MRFSLIAALTISLAGGASAQQVGSVDLTQPYEKQKNDAMPFGCKTLLPGPIGDAVPTTPDHQPHDIVVEIVKLGDDKPVLGDALKAQVRLKNSGTEPIEIPWSTDVKVAEAAEKAGNLDLQRGWFDVVIRTKDFGDILLKNVGRALLSPNSAAGSRLAIRPGEWITAEIQVKLEPDNSYRALSAGEAQLFVRWEQSGESQSVAPNCTAASVYTHYDWYYRQQNPTITIQVSARGTKQY
jgi:hypothetical protein